MGFGIGVAPGPGNVNNPGLETRSKKRIYDLCFPPQSRDMTPPAAGLYYQTRELPYLSFHPDSAAGAGLVRA
jgi:hypothetical protein